MARKVRKSKKTRSDGAKAKKGENKQGKSGKKKAYVLREEHPGVVIPGLLVAAVLLVLGILQNYADLDRLVLLYAGGAAIVLFLIFAPVLYNKKYLYPKTFKPVLILMILLALAGCGTIIYEAGWGRTPLVEKQIILGDPETELALPSGGLYAFYVQSAFEEEEEAEGKKKKKRSSNKSGMYTLSLIDSTDPSSQKSFSGFFEQSRKRRKLSKKARGILEVIKNSDLNTFWAGQGNYSIKLDDITGQLQKELTVKVYKRSFLPYAAMLICLIAVFLGNYLDQIIRNSRIATAFGPAVGAALGFVAYFYYESSPEIQFTTMAMDLLIGGIVGVVGAYGLSAATKNAYDKFIKGRGITL